MPYIDFYTNIHKALRRELFQVSVLAGSTDTSDPRALAVLSDRFAELVQLLRDHSAHEDGFMHPVLASHLPADRERLDQSHEDLDARLDALEQQLQCLSIESRGGNGLAFYRAFNRFVSAYLAHLDTEESDVLPRLWACDSEADLGAMMGRFVTSMSREAIAASAKVMLPALTPSEREAQLQKLRAALPAELLASIERQLTPAARQETPPPASVAAPRPAGPR